MASEPATFTQRALQVIAHIPRGRVATYGQLAAMAGNPHGARQVVRVLWALSDKECLPWHRVINALGRIALAGEGCRLQRQLLEQEGVEFDAAGNIDLVRFQWRPASVPAS